MNHRVGVIPFDIRDDAVAILFITSQTRGRWVLPKGKVEEGETQVETCHREAFEEAGITGVVLENFPITIVVTKQEEDGLGEIPVTYYPFLVLKQANEWPEMNERQRHWALIDQAARVAYREDLLPLVELFDDLLPWVKEASIKYMD
jgi:8-oxo-dGTP pyrophosphatase MutT (NUDIX family)